MYTIYANTTADRNNPDIDVNTTYYVEANTPQKALDIFDQFCKQNPEKQLSFSEIRVTHGELILPNTLTETNKSTNA